MMGVPSINELFDEKYYTSLPGGILENFGRLLKNDLKFTCIPCSGARGRVTNDSDVKVTDDLQPLYDISSVVAVSCSSTTTTPSICQYFHGTCSNASPLETKAGTRWCRRKLPRSFATAVSSDTRKVKGVLSHSTVK